MASSTVAAVDEDDLVGAAHPGNSNVAPMAATISADPLVDQRHRQLRRQLRRRWSRGSGRHHRRHAHDAGHVRRRRGRRQPVQVGNEWFGRAGGEDIFKLSFDTATGEYTFTLLDNIDHPVNSTEDNLTLSFSFTATDRDGDSVTGSLSVNVDDDMPAVTGRVSAALEEGDGSGPATQSITRLNADNTFISPVGEGNTADSVRRSRRSTAT